MKNLIIGISYYDFPGNFSIIKEVEDKKIKILEPLLKDLNNSYNNFWNWEKSNDNYYKDKYPEAYKILGDLINYYKRPDSVGPVRIADIKYYDE